MQQSDVTTAKPRREAANRRAYNEIKLAFPSLSANEGFARAAVGAFIAQFDPTPSELMDVKCAISEAVTNCIVHAYRNTVGTVKITARIYADGRLKVEIKDRGCGIENVKLAREPLFTTDSEGERSGMGFTVMETFSDKVRVRSALGKGTSVVLEKKLATRLRDRYI